MQLFQDVEDLQGSLWIRTWPGLPRQAPEPMQFLGQICMPVHTVPLSETKPAAVDVAAKRAKGQSAVTAEPERIAKAMKATEALPAPVKTIQPQAANVGTMRAAKSRSRRPVCKACLDWSARRSHLAGALGAAMLAHFYANGWARRDQESRAVVFTRAGAMQFTKLFGTPRVGG